MKYKLLVIDCRDETELYSFGENKDMAEGAYRNHCTHFNDKYIVLFECEDSKMKPLATYYRRY